MFIGHFASGLAFYLQKPGGKLTFFLLVLGTQFVDLFWGLFTLLGIEGGFTGGSVEHNFFDSPWSHSLVMVIVWSVLYGIATNYYVASKVGEMNNFGLIAGISVSSHWILDFITHQNDMRIIPTSDTTLPSLYLWEFPILTFVIEFLIIITSWYFYWRYLQNNDLLGDSKKLYGLLGFLSILHIINFIPSFTDADGSEIENSLGLATIILIFLITWGMTWFHPESTVDK